MNQACESTPDQKACQAGRGGVNRSADPLKQSLERRSSQHHGRSFRRRDLTQHYHVGTLDPDREEREFILVVP